MNRGALSVSIDPSVILITGGAGFIGSNLVRLLLRETELVLVNVDLLTYAGNLVSLAEHEDHPRHWFVHGDICDARLIKEILAKHRPSAVMHLAAESHVDRSIDEPQPFVRTNVLGASVLLESCLNYWESLPSSDRDRFRFLHVSTDEVFGSLEADGSPFTEDSPYAPNSPYAASKAASDHLAHAFWRTYGLPTITTNSSNNYGPYQLPEKLVPLMILQATRGHSLPIYGDGLQVRDWLYVEDQCRALLAALEHGQPGQSYNLGADCELTNLEIVGQICTVVDERMGRRTGTSARLIEHVTDRPGHDRRYAINAMRSREQLNWQPQVEFGAGLRSTVAWYLENEDWLKKVSGKRPLTERCGLPRG